MKSFQTYLKEEAVKKLKADEKQRLFNNKRVTRSASKAASLAKK